MTSAFSSWGWQSMKLGLCEHVRAWVQWAAFSFQNCNEASPQSFEKVSSGIFREHDRGRCFASFLFSLSVQVVPHFTAGRKLRMWSVCCLAGGAGSYPQSGQRPGPGLWRQERGPLGAARPLRSPQTFLLLVSSLKKKAPLWSMGAGAGVGT